MNTSQRDILRENRMKIVDDLEPREILDVLLEDGVLTENDNEVISNGKNRRERCQILLALLPTRGPSAYGAFTKALGTASYQHLEATLSVDRAITNNEKHESSNQTTICSRCREYISPQDVKNPEFLHALVRNCCLLFQNIEPNDVLDYHYQEGILSEDECECIRVGKTRKQRCVTMLQTLASCSSVHLMPVFQKSLQKKYFFIANIMDTSLSNIQNQTCEKQTLAALQSQFNILHVDELCHKLHVNNLVDSACHDIATNQTIAEETLSTDHSEICSDSGGTIDTNKKLPSSTQLQKAIVDPLSYESSMSVSPGRQPVSPGREPVSPGLQPVSPSRQPVHLGSLGACDIPKISSQHLSTLDEVDSRQAAINDDTAETIVTDILVCQPSRQSVHLGSLGACDIPKISSQHLSTLDEVDSRQGAINGNIEQTIGTDILICHPLKWNCFILRESSTDSDYEPNKRHPTRKRKARHRKVENLSNKQTLQKPEANASFLIQPGVVDPYELPDRKLLTAFNSLSNLINQGKYDQFEFLSAHLRQRYLNDPDMMCILGYLHASNALYKTDYDAAKQHINAAFEIVPQTKNPKYFTLELFTAKTRMYISQKKFEKLQTILEDAKMIIESDKIGCSGRAAGWLFMNDARNLTAQITMLNVRSQNYIQVYKRFHNMAKASFHRSLANFQKDGGKDGPFGMGYAVCRLVILLMQCGDSGLTLDVLHPPAEDIVTAGSYLRQLEDSNIAIPKILEMHYLLAKCDYQFRRNNIVRALEHSQAAYDIATEINLMEFIGHAHNRLVFLRTKTPVIIHETDDFEEARNILFQDESNTSS